MRKHPNQAGCAGRTSERRGLGCVDLEIRQAAAVLRLPSPSVHLQSHHFFQQVLPAAQQAQVGYQQGVPAKAAVDDGIVGGVGPHGHASLGKHCEATGHVHSRGNEQAGIGNAAGCQQGLAGLRIFVGVFSSQVGEDGRIGYVQLQQLLAQKAGLAAFVLAQAGIATGNEDLPDGAAVVQQGGLYKPVGGGAEVALIGSIGIRDAAQQDAHRVHPAVLLRLHGWLPGLQYQSVQVAVAKQQADGDGGPAYPCFPAAGAQAPPQQRQQQYPVVGHQQKIEQLGEHKKHAPKISGRFYLVRSVTTRFESSDAFRLRLVLFTV